MYGIHLCRNRRIPLNQLRAYAAERLDTERKRGHIEKEDILHIALEDSALDGSADRDDLIRVDSLMGFLAEELLDQLLHAGDPGGTADEDDFIDIGSADACVPEGIEARHLRPLHERSNHLLELRP